MKKFNIHEWQANQIKQSLKEHTVTFSKKDMADLHKKGEIKKKAEDGKEHTYIYKDDLKEAKNCGCGKDPCETYGNINEQDFDARLAQQMGMSSDEFEDQVASRDIESPFPNPEDNDVSAGYRKASDLIDKLRQEYRSMSDEDLDDFSVAMVEHFLDNLSAQVRAKTILTKRGI